MSPSAVSIFVSVLCLGYVSAVERDYSTQPGETVLYLNNENNTSLSDVYNITNRGDSFTRPLEVEEEREDNRPTDDVRVEEELNYLEQFKCFFRKDVDITVVYSSSNVTFTKGDESKNGSYCLLFACYYRINGRMSKGFCVTVYTVNTTEFEMSRVKNEEIIVGLTPGIYELFRLFVKINNYEYDDQLGFIGPLLEDEDVDGEGNGLRLINFLGRDDPFNSEVQICEQNKENVIKVVYNVSDGTFTEEQAINGANYLLLPGFYRVNSNLTVPTCFHVYSINSSELAKKFLEVPKVREIPFKKPFIIRLTKRIFIRSILYIEKKNLSMFVNFTYHEYIRTSDLTNLMTTLYYPTLFVTSTISIVGNFIICLVIIKYKTMRNSPNIYVFNISLSDIVTFSMALVVNVINWKFFKSGLIKRIWYTASKLQSLSRKVNVWTTVGLTVDRYVGICHPFLARTVSTQSKAVKINIDIWIVVVLYILVDELCLHLSNIGYNSPVINILEHIFFNYTPYLILFAFLPMVIIIVMYVFIVRSIWKSSKLKGSSNTLGQSMAGKSLKLSVAVVVQFFITYVPFSTINYVQSFLNGIGVDKFYTELLINGIHTVMLLSSAMDLVLYSLVSKRFRDAFKDLLCPSWNCRKCF